MAKPKHLSFEAAGDFLRQVSEKSFPMEWDRDKQKLHGLDESGEKTWSFRMPLCFPMASPEISLADYAEDLNMVPAPYFMILMQAGHAAMAYFEDGEVVHHKVVKKYMVRRGQGKSQIGYLGSRGKSKAGSRVRLANSVRFFEDINAKLKEWDTVDEVERILLSCPVRLKPLLFSSKILPPFEKKDPRIIKVPLDIHRPDFEELLRVDRICARGHFEGDWEKMFEAL